MLYLVDSPRKTPTTHDETQRDAPSATCTSHDTPVVSPTDKSCDTPTVSTRDTTPPAVTHPAASRNVVTVSGINGTTTEELLRMFFQSKKRSGGGPVKDIHYWPTDGQATITFHSDEGTHPLNNYLHPPMVYQTNKYSILILKSFQLTSSFLISPITTCMYTCVQPHWFKRFALSCITVHVSSPGWRTNHNK